MKNRKKIDKVKILILQEIYNRGCPTELTADFLPKGLQKFFSDSVDELINFEYIVAKTTWAGIALINGITKEGIDWLENKKFSNKIKNSYIWDKVIKPIIISIIVFIIGTIITEILGI